MSDPLFLLPPGSPELPSPPLLPTALPPPSLGPARPFYRPLPRGFTDLPQREIDGIRIHFYLLFYDEHALLWSGLEQHFAEMDEKRFNRALAWLEEVDAIEIVPAPAPNPFSPPDALVSLLPHPELSPSIRQSALLPLPWPGSHVHSPGVTDTPGGGLGGNDTSGGLVYGFPVNLNEDEYLAETTGANSLIGTGAETRRIDSGRQTGGAISRGAVGGTGSITASGGSIPSLSRRPTDSLTRALSISHLKMGGHHVDTLSSLSLAYQQPPTPSSSSRSRHHGHDYYPHYPGGTFSEISRYKMGTVTPPPSDRWMSEETTPLVRAVRVGPDGVIREEDVDEGEGEHEDEDDEVEPYSLDEGSIESGEVVTESTKRQLSSRANDESNDTPQSKSRSVGWHPLRLTEDIPPAPASPTYLEPPRGFEGDTDLATTAWTNTASASTRVRKSVGPTLNAQQEKERLEELWEIAASVVPPMPNGVGGKASHVNAVITTTASLPPKPLDRTIPAWLPALLIPLALSLILHPVLYAASSSPTLRVPSLVVRFLTTLPPPTFPALEANLGFSIIALIGMLYAVPWMGDAFIAKDLKGRDLLKGPHGAVIPECMGLPGAAMYIGLMIMFIPFPFSKYFEDSINEWSGAGAETLKMEQAVGRRTFPHQELALYLSSILSLLIATLLGFLDDVFDIRWRHKLPIPIIASIPLLMVYYAEGGLTTVVMPIGARWLVGKTVNLGPLYYIYMSLLSTFSTNSINILAGVNGLEVGQALVIALSVALNDAMYLPIWPRIAFGQPGQLGEVVLLEGGPILRRGSEELIQRHLLSLYFMGPLIGVCLGLLYHNWYPARAFVGDTFCYFAGMAFAVVAIQGHFSKTLLLFFIPQIFNFLLSCPQLFGFVACPRHRLPKLDSQTGLLQPSFVVFATPPPLKTTITLKILSALKLTRITYDSQGTILSATNLTIMTVILVHRPMREDDLTKTIMWFQVIGSAAAFFIRYGIASLLYDGDRR